MQNASAIASLANEVIKSATNILMVLLSSNLNSETKKNLLGKHAANIQTSLAELKALI